MRSRKETLAVLTSVAVRLAFGGRLLAFEGATEAGKAAPAAAVFLRYRRKKLKGPSA